MQQRVTIGPLRDEDGIAGVIVTVEDVTPRLDARAARWPPHCRARTRTSAAGRGGSRRGERIESGDVSLRRCATTTGACGRPRCRGLPARRLRLHPRRDRSVRATIATSTLLSSALKLLADDRRRRHRAAASSCSQDPDADLRIQAALALGEQHDPAAIDAADRRRSRIRRQRALPGDRVARPAARRRRGRRAGRRSSQSRRLLSGLRRARRAGGNRRSARRVAAWRRCWRTTQLRGAGGRCARRARRRGRSPAAGRRAQRRAAAAVVRSPTRSCDSRSLRAPVQRRRRASPMLVRDRLDRRGARSAGRRRRGAPRRALPARRAGARMARWRRRGARADAAAGRPGGARRGDRSARAARRSGRRSRSSSSSAADDHDTRQRGDRRRSVGWAAAARPRALVAMLEDPSARARRWPALWRASAIGGVRATAGAARSPRRRGPAGCDWCAEFDRSSGAAGAGSRSLLDE